jgi:hypothetical protein
MLLGQNLAVFGPLTASHISSSIPVAEGFALGRTVGVSVTIVTRDADKTERFVTVDINYLRTSPNSSDKFFEESW